MLDTYVKDTAEFGEVEIIYEAVSQVLNCGSDSNLYFVPVDIPPFGVSLNREIPWDEFTQATQLEPGHIELEIREKECSIT